MASLFDPPQWDRAPRPAALELSRTHRDIHHALQDTSLFQSGVQVIPQTQGQVSLQPVGPQAPTGPSLIGSPATMAAIPEPDPHRRQLIQALQTPGRGWQFGPSGSAQQLPTGFATPPPVPQLIPFSPQKPALVGGIPLGAPKIKTGSEDVHVGGVVIHPEGTIQQEPSAPLTQLAPLATLAPVDLQKPTSLGAGPALSDISKLSIPTIVPIEPLVSGLAPSLVKPPGAPPLGMIPALPSLTTLPSVATFVPPPALGEIMEREGREGGE